MATYNTRTEEFGHITFTAPSADADYAGYVYMETYGGGRRQICCGGDFRGSAVTATAAEVKSEAQKWLRQRREWMRKEGL